MNDNSRLTKFFVVAVLFFIWGTVQGAIQAQGPVHEFLEQGPAGIIVGAHVHVGTLGWVSLALMGTLYYLVPQVSVRSLSWPGLVNWVFWIATITIALNTVLMILAGINGGNAFIAGVKGPELNAVLAPYMMILGISSIVCAVILFLFSVQIIHTATKSAAS